MKILHKLNALPKKPKTHKVGDLELRFYPVPVRTVLSQRMAEILGPILGAVSTLLEPKGRDSKVIEEYAPDGSMARATDSISPEMASYRAEKKQKALDEALQTIFDKKNQNSVAYLILLSLRDEWTDGKPPTEEDAEAFMSHPDMDMDAFGEFFKGFLKANTTVMGGQFGDLGNLIRERIVQTIDRASSTPSSSDTSLDTESDERSENENDSPAPMEEDAVPPTSTPSS